MPPVAPPQHMSSMVRERDMLMLRTWRKEEEEEVEEVGGKTKVAQIVRHLALPKKSFFFSFWRRDFRNDEGMYECRIQEGR